jgi:Domain of unknown function (DUF6434)
MKQLSEIEITQLREALSHLHIKELKTHLEKLNLSTQAFNKHELIERLMHYIKTGQELPPLEIPPAARAVRGAQYPLASHTRMLFGSYKNDLATRNFFKHLIGNHFHFTAQGIDWLREQWLQETPPTYADFAREWQSEYERNKTQKRPAKQEWAYIRFVQEYMHHHPQASKTEVTSAWNLQRQQYARIINTALKELSWKKSQSN